MDVVRKVLKTTTKNPNNKSKKTKSMLSINK